MSYDLRHKIKVTFRNPCPCCGVVALLKPFDAVNFHNVPIRFVSMGNKEVYWCESCIVNYVENKPLVPRSHSECN